MYHKNLLANLLLSCLIASSWASSSTLPNVVLIYADDLGYGDTSAYGATKIKTPEFDKIAAGGIKFTNARTSAATCTPSRYSLMTGRYAWRQKGTGILPGDANLIIPTDRTTLGKVFQKAGYQTAVIGKWHLGLGDSKPIDWNKPVSPGPNEVGFHYSFIFPATGDRVPTVYMRNHNVVALDPDDPISVNYKEKIGDEPTGKENPELLKMPADFDHGHDNTIVNGIGRIGWMTGGHKARWTDESLALDFTQEAEQFIERNRSSPFFLFFATNDIHVPRMPGTRFKGTSGLGYRGDALLQLDHTIGRIAAKLDHLGLTSNTLIMITSDNGPVLNDGYIDGAVEELNGHTPWGPLRGGKGSIFEAGTRVPFVAKWPEKIPAGKSSDALISQVDLVATFADLTDQEFHKEFSVDSENVLPALLGETDKGRESVVVHAATSAVIAGDWKYIAPNDGPAFREKVKIETGFAPHPQLYNLKNDIAEKENLAEKHPEKVEELKKILETVREKSWQASNPGGK